KSDGFYCHFDLQRQTIADYCLQHHGKGQYQEGRYRRIYRYTGQRREEMNEAIFAQLQKEMDQSVGALRKELAKLRTGRASTALLQHIVVAYYVAHTPLTQFATL